MDAVDVAKVCLKRWYVALPIILLAMFAGYGLSKSQKPTYAGTGSFALLYTHTDLIKPNAEDPRSPNPIAAGGTGLLGEAIIAQLSSPPEQRALAAPGVSGTSPSDTPNGSAFSLYIPQNQQSILVSTWGQDPKAVHDTIARVLAAAPTRAAMIQDRLGAPPISQFTTFVTLDTQVVELPPPSTMKLLIAVTAVGVLAGAALSVLVDRLATRRRTRRKVPGRRLGRRRRGEAEDAFDEADRTNGAEAGELELEEEDASPAAAAHDTART